jgi:hypothetical protein
MSRQVYFTDIRSGEPECGRTEIAFDEESSRWMVSAYNEGGLNGVDIDILDLIAWVRENKPEWLAPQE